MAGMQMEGRKEGRKEGEGIRQPWGTSNESAAYASIAIYPLRGGCTNLATAWHRGGARFYCYKPRTWRSQRIAKGIVLTSPESGTRMPPYPHRPYEEPSYNSLS